MSAYEVRGGRGRRTRRPAGTIAQFAQYQGGPLDGRDNVLVALLPEIRHTDHTTKAVHVYRPTGEQTARGRHVYAWAGTE